MTTPPRRPPTKDEIVAACILDIIRDGKPIVSREEAKHLTAKEVYEVFRDRIDVDHIVPREVGGPDHHANYQPLLRATEHKVKTKRDVREIAKTKRIRKAQSAHEAAMAEKISLAPTVAKMETRRSRKWATRPMAGTKKSGLRKRLNGKVERRTDAGSR